MAKEPEYGYIIIHTQTGCWDGLYNSDIAHNMYDKLRSKYTGTWILAKIIRMEGVNFKKDRFLASNFDVMDEWLR